MIIQREPSEISPNLLYVLMTAGIAIVAVDEVWPLSLLWAIVATVVLSRERDGVPAAWRERIGDKT